MSELEATIERVLADYGLHRSTDEWVADLITDLATEVRKLR